MVVSESVFHFITEPAIKLLPLAVNVNVAEPAVIEDGEMVVKTGVGLATGLMVKVNAADVPPPGVGLNIVTLAVPAVSISDAGTLAVSCVLLINVVTRERVFHLITDPAMKLLPLAVNVNVAAPAVTEVGAMEVNNGEGFEIVKVDADDVPPPGVGLNTVTLAVPGVSTSDDCTVAVSCVVLIKDVTRERLFHFIIEPEIKLVPVIEIVNEASPTIAEVGEIDVTIGTGLEGTLIVKINVADDPPPGAGLKILMFAVPATITSDEGTVAVNCILLM